MAGEPLSALPSQRGPGPALSRWVVLVRKHPIMVHFLAGLAITVCLDALFALVGVGGAEVWKEPGIELGSVVVGFATPLIVTTAALSHQFRRLLAIVRSARPEATPVMLRILSEELREMETKVDELQVVGRSYPSNAIPGWVGIRCFSVTRGRYLGIDTRTPSEFMECYGAFLDEHAAYLRRTGRHNSVRVNLAAKSDLLADMRRSPADYEAYYRWHEDNGVRLLHRDPDDARAIAARCGLGQHQIDVGLWVGELVLSARLVGRRVRVTLGLAGGPLYRVTTAYVEELLLAPGRFPPPTA
jgi:hypothetical protein